MSYRAGVVSSVGVMLFVQCILMYYFLLQLFQAQKIISLCGWEPCLLPYAVDDEDKPSESSGDIIPNPKSIVLSWSVIKSLYQEFASKEVTRVENASSSHPQEVARVGEKRKSRFAQYVETIENEPTKTDLDIYLEEKNLQWNEEVEFDILSWWKSNSGKYPILAKVARDILGIPASTVASESAFSTEGRVIHCYRSRMTTDTVEALICTQDWLKAEKEVARFDTIWNKDEDIITDEDDDSNEIRDTFVKASDILDVYDMEE